MTDRVNILRQIAVMKSMELDLLKKENPEKELHDHAKLMPAPKSLYDSLKSKDGIRVIAEIKKASPSKGMIRRDFQYEKFASEYLEAGAAAISVLTEGNYFLGSLDYLKRIAALAADTPVPVLRKDFIFDPYQITEARAAGADAILLIAALIRSDELFAQLLNYSHELGMDALCEAHNDKEVKRLIRLGARIIGVNSRDLRTFHTDITQTGKLLKRIPETCAAVAESGIKNAEDFALLPADAYLIGETLMRAEHPGEKLRELRGARPCIR